ncbi:two component, sigma54 specific, transcriptional regulator, Fis family [Candidatus Vecturithrix granuli]|uniref:Two component, sigma54 specific, transcriptional regulator, Fis family n=1 Tax=Vecturithrix granuli TaxID=1499967 RepID=A0A081C913_VECG1|nr:two component, sigma54 specific, transcriptional regulator, Fis family [Candidatus Vecturithrix granuli]
MSYTILLIDDEEEMCLSLADVLSMKGYSVRYTTDPLDVPRMLAHEKFDLLIMDIKMPKMSGIDLLNVIKTRNPAIAVIMITGYPTIENAVQAMKYGALNFYVKPLKLTKLLQEIQELAAKSERKRTQQPSHHPIVTREAAVQDILDTIAGAAPTSAPVLITGESGTGKELVANSLHQLSPRRDKPFVKVNCAALPENLLESELFGHEKGAFTGAVKERKGRFELAHTGTILLDEIGDMSLKTQAKILRVLQEQEFERVGGVHTIKTDSRVIAATNKHLKKLIEAHTFREDLYYRLSVITIHLPPLRERPKDILPLTDYFIAHYNSIYQKQIQGVSQEVQWFLSIHKWPGNVRELKNCIERAVIFCQQDVIGIEHLAAQYKEIIATPTAADYEQTLENLNRDMILDALGKSKGVKKKAADLLNINRRTLYNRMKKFGIDA